MNGYCYDLFMTPFEMVALRQARAELISDLTGRILEIGSGTGANFHLYRQPELVTAVEPDPKMLSRALQVKPERLTLQPGKAEELTLENDSVEHVVSTLVFCSVEDLALSIQEICRVSSPGARLHLIEHVKGCGPVGTLHEICTPLWSKLCGGCHLNRDTIAVLREAGFEVEGKRVVLNFLGTPFVFCRLRIPVVSLLPC